jgi:mono/diheme cytochrome c family protein
MRDSILLHLAQEPEAQDRDKFLVGLESSNRQVVAASLASLEKLPPDATRANLAPLLRLLRRLTLETAQQPQRQQATALIARQSGHAPWEIREEGPGPTALRKSYEPVFAAFDDLKKDLESGGSVDVAALLKPVLWDDASAPRGQEIFRTRGCQTCHAVQGALGPNLAGAASRFSTSSKRSRTRARTSRRCTGRRCSS